MERQIQDELVGIERKHDVRILYACESGSRGWGFASADSDWDVRFIYCHPRDWYLSIEEKRDVIELPIDDLLDVNGWDIRKALRLMKKSNPVLLEWLSSPIVYREEGASVSALRALARDCYQPTACLHHYLHMAQGNFREYLQGETVWLKKYFYVLRPVLACLWIERGLGMVPMAFEDLVSGVVKDAGLKAAIAGLIELKRAAAELSNGAPIPEIHNFLLEEMSRLGAVVAATPKRPVAGGMSEKIDACFRGLLLDGMQAGDVEFDPPRSRESARPAEF
ncbi:MAG: nucleotidyltransferase domain-containing protein [Sideroxydans sp.]|nr:nucleotidyltransferase domain-containing protein [Sideroxydans sp.]